MASCTKHGEWPHPFFACPKCFKNGDVTQPIWHLEEHGAYPVERRSGEDRRTAARPEVDATEQQWREWVNEGAVIEDAVRAGAKAIAASPLIDAPKLSYNEWMGLSRAVLEAAFAVSPQKTIVPKLWGPQDHKTVLERIAYLLRQGGHADYADAVHRIFEAVTTSLPHASMDRKGAVHVTMNNGDSWWFKDGAWHPYVEDSHDMNKTP